MDFVSPIITPIVESLLVPVKRHLDFLVSSTKYVREMKNKMSHLDRTEQDIQTKKKLANVKNHEVSHHVSPWLEDVKKMKEMTQNIPTSGIGCFNVAKRYKTGKQSCTILEDIKALIEQECGIIWTNEEKPLARVPSTVAPVVPGATQDNFESRDLVFKDALKALQPNNESEKMIALCGMGGVGKTTMMEQLKKVVEDSKMFDWVVKVVLGENPDPIAIQQAIAEYVGKDLSETTKNARADRLLKIFEGMSEQGQKKILVIMDDVWKDVNLKDIGLATPLPKGFKLLFTSRSEYVCTQMGVKTSSIFNIHVLKKAEAKTLFYRIVGLCESEGNDPELQKMGEDIVKKCGNLPIAIITIAKVLNSNIKEAWKETLSNLENNDLQDLDDIVHKVFEMSYNNLKKDDDKAIFLLSGLFPEDCNIPLEDLMMYGWGLNLFTKVNTLAEARRRTNVCVNNLIRANLLTQSGSAGYVKMHDLVRAFVLSNFSKVKQASIFNHDNMSLQWRTEDTQVSYNRILLKCTDMSEFSVNFFTKHADLSLLILIDGNRLLKFPKDLYRTMEKLEVVSYQNMYLPSLPVTFVHSTKLRTLCLRSCSLINDDICFIGSLSNLETLSFANCGLRRLPSTIGKLKKLKLLDITGCVSLCIEDGVFQNLESLEELYMRASPGQPIRFTDANCDELEILSSRLFALELEFFENKVQSKYVSFKNLERFRISIGCESKYIEKYSFINTLDLVADCNELQECNITDLFEETEELQLQVKNMNNLEDVSLHHTFSHLRVLHVSMCAELTYLFTFAIASGLKKLERLTVSRCHVLKALVGGSSRVGAIGFQKLTFMSLVDLPKMVGLCDDMIELPELVELRLDGLPIFTTIYSDNSNICASQSLLNEKVVIPKLEKLYISSLEGLKQIWPSYISSAGNNNICILKEVTVRRCDSLMNLFPRKPLPLLNHLEKLEVEDCSSIEVLFNIDFEHVCEMDGYRTCRLRCISVYGLDKLKELWRIRGVNNSADILINGFKNVESIEIRFCKGFRNLFTPITSNFDLKALTTYNTWKIGEQIDGISKGEITEVDDYIPNVTYPSYLLRTCPRLQYLDLREDKRVGDVVFEIDHPSSEQSEAIDQPRLLLPYLEVLKLTFLEETNHVWKCNWNKFTIPQRQPLQLPFQNLTHIILKYSHKIKYLFSPLMAKYLSSLKFVDINRCNGIEEVISSRDDEKEENTTSASSHKNITFFPYLDTLALEFLSRLKSVDGGDIRTNTIHEQFQINAQVISDSWWFCQYPRKIIICRCDALESLIPWYAVAQMKRLEELEMESCNGMIEVFESKSINYSTSNVDEGSASHGAGIGATLTSPMLKHTNTVVVPKLFNLKRVIIIGCDFLPHIFTFSTLESLNQLKELKVKKCNAIQVIVKEEKGTSSKVVVFPRLESLQLENLPNLKGFFLGVNDFRFPSLDDVVIDDCPQLIMFTSGESKTKKLRYIRTGFGKHCLEYGLNFQAVFPTCSNDIISKGMSSSFHNLIEINIKAANVKTIIPSHALLQLQKLEQITIHYCQNIEEVFEVELEGTDNSGFNGSQIVVKLPNLTQVDLQWVKHLKYLWKSTQWKLLEFPNLTTVSIQQCDSLEHVFTCSMVGSLLQLQDLNISYCENIKVIVKKEEEEEYDAKVNDIMLPRLKSVKLEYLRNLKGFCLGDEGFSCPSLDTLEIKECPAISVFTMGRLFAPELKVIDAIFGMCYVSGGLNSFIKTKQEEGHEL